MMHPSSQMPRRRLACLRSTVLHATFFHSHNLSSQPSTVAKIVCSQHVPKCRPRLSNVTTKLFSVMSPPIFTSPSPKPMCCSIPTSPYDVVVSAPSFAGCRLFPSCKNLLARSFVQKTTFDSNELAQHSAHTQTRMAHKPSDRKVVRAKQRTQKCTQHSVVNVQLQQ